MSICAFIPISKLLYFSKKKPYFNISEIIKMVDGNIPWLFDRKKS